LPDDEAFPPPERSPLEPLETEVLLAVEFFEVLLDDELQESPAELKLPEE